MELKIAVDSKKGKGIQICTSLSVSVGMSSCHLRLISPKKVSETKRQSQKVEKNDAR